MRSIATAASPTISAVELESEQLRQVLALHRANKQWLGFLPDAGFEDRVAAGTLLAAVAQGELMGYVLFDLPGNRVKIVHLCVDPKYRTSGVARQLVDEVSSRHQTRVGIELACRRDFPASGLWPRVGFHPAGERPGRATAGSVLTVWFRDHGHPDLFSVAPHDRELAAIDQMVLEDLVSDDPHGLESRYLIDDWVAELVELCVTDQVFHETNDCIDERRRLSLRSHAAQCRHIARSVSASGDLLTKIAELAPSAGTGDHLHVALAVSGSADYFVTRDGPLLQHAEALATHFDIAVLRPEALIDRLDRARRQDRYEPAALQGTAIKQSRLAADEQDDFAVSLLNNAAGERLASLRAVLRPALADPAGQEVIAFREPSGRLLAGLVRRFDSERLVVEAIRVRGVGPLSEALARQLAFSLRAAAADRGAEAVLILDPCPSRSVLRALPNEGFERKGTDWICRVKRGILPITEMGTEFEGAENATAMENRLWPLKLLDAGIPTYMISIEPAWAELLFEARLAGETLFPRELGLGLSREHVYYRSIAGLSIRSPGRILWYVKKGKHGHPEGHLRAVSQLAEVVRGHPKALYRRFSRLGAWSFAQVQQAAGERSEAMALRVVDTELLATPLSLEELRTVYHEAGSVFHAPQAPIAVEETMFGRLYARSSAYAE